MTIYNVPFRNETFKQATYVKLNESNFSSCILFAYLFNVEDDRIETCYWRVDSCEVEKKVKDFLDTYFPLGDVDMGAYGVPYEG